MFNIDEKSEIQWGRAYLLVNQFGVWHSYLFFNKFYIMCATFLAPLLRKFAYGFAVVPCVIE